MSLRRLFRPRRKLPFAEWGWDVRHFHLPVDGVVQFAQWRHPCDRPTSITQAEVDGLRRFIRPGDFAIDVGAHTGDTTVPMALAAGAAGCVLALEPNRHVFKVLEENAVLSRKRQQGWIEPRCIAATDEDGDFLFHYGDASFCNGGLPMRPGWNLFRKRKFPLAVTGRNLLRLLRRDFAEWLPKLSYVKVDAEGHDLAILRSILPVLRERRPVVRTEVFKKLSRVERHALFDLLASAGYELFRFEGGDDPQGSPIRRDRMTADRHFDVLAIPRI